MGYSLIDKIKMWICAKLTQPIQEVYNMSFFPVITTSEKVTLSVTCVMSGLIVLYLFSNVFENKSNCIVNDEHKWGKWEVIGRRILYDNSAVNERTCVKCNFKELE
tara:strand:+ start:474 stop:791 length:318 start_codon:yes stop_codon:yes gene_type:complete